MADGPVDRTYLDEVDGFDGPGAAGDMVEIGLFLDPSEAQMVKGMLGAAGIEAFVDGENANALYPGIFRAIVTVRTTDQTAARALLQQADEHSLQTGNKERI